MGAAANLEAYLNKVSPSTASSPQSSNPRSASDSVFSAVDARSPISPISEWSSLPSSPLKFRGHPETPLQGPAHHSHHVVSRFFAQPLWLYVCIQEPSHSTRMRHLDVNMARITSDGDLVIALSKLYSRVRKGWSAVLQLRGIVGVRFVQVSKILLNAIIRH